MTKTYLGIDSSTQSITATLIEAGPQGELSQSRIVYEKSLNFDQHFPEFGTRNGVLPEALGKAHTPPQLWVKALETLLFQMQQEGIALNQVAAIATSGQQHGSIYLNERAESVLASLQPQRGLADQLSAIYSRPTSPIWMDASTSQECKEITEALGGDAMVCSLTGSRCFERFTGPQIRKFAKDDPVAYASTRHILLVSSFIPTLLAGKVVGIDPGDGAGMNLMDISQQQWSAKALAVTAVGLAEKLAPIVQSDRVVGLISPYFVSRFGFAPTCQVLPGTGDNPSSLVGLGLTSGGRLGISLGTSDTLFAFMGKPKIDPAGASHVFGSPTGDYMAISVYKNGSLAREAVRKQYGLTWEAFSDALQSGEPGNAGRVLLPYFDTEIIPRIARAGVVRKGLDSADVVGNVRAVVEAQMTSMLLHSEWMGETPKAIAATGGASNNLAILQVMANVFGVPVARQETASAAALGAALRAQHGHLKSSGQSVDWEQVVAPHRKPTVTLQPDREAHRAYQAFKERYRQVESEYVMTLS